MNINEFLLNLVDNDCDVKNLAFKENNNEFINSVTNFKSKFAIAISSSFFLPIHTLHKRFISFPKEKITLKLHFFIKKFGHMKKIY